MTTEQRNAIKAAGGGAYAELLAMERDARSLQRRRHGKKLRVNKGKQYPLPLVHAAKPPEHHVKRNIWLSAKYRAREQNREFTIRFVDIVWPTHCPVLGLELDYTPVGSRSANNPSNPSLDRWDNTKGYVDGNVFVISMRANNLKSNATWQELEAVLNYARSRPSVLRLVA